LGAITLVSVLQIPDRKDIYRHSVISFHSKTIV